MTCTACWCTTALRWGGTTLPTSSATRRTGTRCARHLLPVAAARADRLRRWFEFNDTNVSEIPASDMRLALQLAREQAESARRQAEAAVAQGGELVLALSRGGEAAAVTASGSTAGAGSGAAAPADGTGEEASAVDEAGNFSTRLPDGFSASVIPSVVADEGATGEPAAAAESASSEAAPAPGVRTETLRRADILRGIATNAYMLLYRCRTVPAGEDAAGSAVTKGRATRVGHNVPAALRAEVEADNERTHKLRRAFAVHKRMTCLRCGSLVAHATVRSASPAHVQRCVLCIRR